MLEAENAFALKGLDFAKHAIAITGDGQLHQYSQEKGWLDFLPMWDWVEGEQVKLQQSVFCPQLYRIDIDDLLGGATDGRPYTKFCSKNPAAMLALSWHILPTEGNKDMVILPYKDRLDYLQNIFSN